MTDSVRVEFVCEQCGSANVSSDAFSRWDVPRQQWVVVGHYDSSECLDCAEETGLVKRVLTDQKSDNDPIA
jgi:hypothetical protein